MNKFLIFDLDGTLIDTLPMIYKSCLDYLKWDNLNYQYSIDEVKSFIGKGARNLFAKLIKKDDFSEEKYQKFLDFYYQRQFESKPFKDVYPTLKNLEKDYALLIYSNKPDELLKPLVNKIFNDIHFLYVQGADYNYPLKPNPALINKILEKLNLKKELGYFLGDSEVDLELAKNAKIKSIIFTYGYGNYDKIIQGKPDYILDEFIKLYEVL